MVGRVRDNNVKEEVDLALLCVACYIELCKLYISCMVILKQQMASTECSASQVLGVYSTLQN